MTTVREATFQMLRERGMTTMFGNPGSTELPMLADFPEDFRYVLALHEAVAVGMADGYAQAVGRPAWVNLHTAPGVGNGMGAVFNAKANKSPVVVTAGQQARSLMTLEANLTNRDAARMPQPLVKWSYEPPRPQDVPHALARAQHMAALPPAGPTFVSIPMDDWDVDVDDDAVAHQTRREVGGRAVAEPGVVSDLGRRLAAAKRPALVAGPGIDASGGWDAAVALAEAQRLPGVGHTGAGRRKARVPRGPSPVPRRLPPAIGPMGEALSAYDLVIVAGSSVFPFYPNIPGPLLAEGTQLVAITDDPDEAARAPMGEAVVADVALTLAALAIAAGGSDRPPPDAARAPSRRRSRRRSGPTRCMPRWPRRSPTTASSCSSRRRAPWRFATACASGAPRSYWFGAGGGLGFGLAASMGVQLAQPDRPVVCVLGEGSAQYAITGLWTAAAYRLPVTFLVLNNSEYSILKWFAGLEGVTGAPGLDLPALDCAAIAESYGVRSQSVDDRDELHAALSESIAGR